MSKITARFLAVALASTSIAASAQETFKADLFGQQPVNVGDVTAPAAPHKLNITNAGAPDTTAETVKGALAPAGSQPDLAFPGTPQTPNKASNPPNEFQKFVADGAGKILPVFGAEFFASAPSTFAPIVNSPVPTNHSLGPGDELLIRAWGSIDVDYRATVDRNGTISIPTIGTIVLAGVKAGEAESVIRGAFEKLYKGVTVNVNFGHLRAITVYVVGQASRPGTYTVSSLSTLVTALFASGGPNSNGTMRGVQVKRAGKVVAELDLYAFIGKGDKSADINLQDGDSIYIPPAGGFVALVGKVNTPAIYELKTGSDTVEALLDFAGGLPVVADPRRAFLERVDAVRNHPRTVEQFALNGDGLKRTLKNGDVLNITSITPDFANAVVLRGNVDQPIRAPFKQGMRVRDLIPSREYLISRASTKRQNNAVGAGDSERDMTLAPADTDKNLPERRAKRGTEDIAASIGQLIDEINWDYAVVERINRADLTVSLIPFNLSNVFTNPDGADNVQLQPGDTVTIFSGEDVAVPMDKRRVFVRVEGEVKVPGVYQMTARDTLQMLLARAGGPTDNAYLFGTAFYREAVRKEQEVNLQKAAMRLESQLRSEQAKGIANARALAATDAQAAVAQRAAEVQVAEAGITRFRQIKPTGRIAFGLEPGERSFARLPQIKLENGDRLVVPAKPAFVHVFGAVNSETSPLWRPNTRVKDYLKVVGATSEADLDNVFVMRVDGTVMSSDSRNWLFGSIGGLEIMPGDSIVVPEKLDRESTWSRFTRGTREWAQIFANFGLGAAAIKTLRN